MRKIGRLLGVILALTLLGGAGFRHWRTNNVSS